MKIVLNKPASGFNLAAIVENFTNLEIEFQNKVLYRNNPTGEPNTMETDLDMNGKRILNLPELTVGGVNVGGLTSAMVWRGAWSNTTAYAKSDAVSYGGSSYICVTPHTGSTPPSANWNLFAQAGTSGIGNVNGPASSADSTFPLFDGITGKVIKDSGITVAGAKTAFGLGPGDVPDFAGLNGGQLAGFRNKLINPKFDVLHRTYSNNASNNYFTDRWMTFNTGTAHSSSSITGSMILGTYFSTVIQLIGTTGNTAATLLQRIESRNSGDLAGKTVTFSAYVQHQGTGGSRNVVIATNNPTSSDNWGAATAIGNSGNISVPLNTWTRISWTTTLPASGPNLGLDFQLQFGALTSGQSFFVTGCQLEVGGILTPFEHRSVASETLMAQRYAEEIKIPASFRFSMLMADATTTSAMGSYMSYKVSKRSAPTPTIASGGISILTSAGSNPGGTTLPLAAGNDGFVLQLTGATGLTAGQSLYVGTTSGGLRILVNDELF